MKKNRKNRRIRNQRQTAPNDCKYSSNKKEVLDMFVSKIINLQNVYNSSLSRSIKHEVAAEKATLQWETTKMPNNVDESVITNPC